MLDRGPEFGKWRRAVGSGHPRSSLARRDGSHACPNPPNSNKNRPRSGYAQQNAQISLAISQNVSHGVVWGSERSEALHLRQQLRRLPDLGEESLRAALDQERQGGQHFMLHASLWSAQILWPLQNDFSPEATRLGSPTGYRGARGASPPSSGAGGPGCGRAHRCPKRAPLTRPRR